MISSAVLFVATVLMALNAGFFYTWSHAIFAGLAALDPAAAIAAMNAINANIRSGWFAVVFFGGPLSLFVALVVCLVARSVSAAGLVAGALLLVLGTVAITMLYHIPWNNQLAAQNLGVGSGILGGVWQSYSTAWLAWNHARTACSCAAFVLTAFAWLRVSAINSGDSKAGR